MNDLSDFVEALSQGVAQRATAATRMNINSSRSHAVLTVNVRIEPIGGGAAHWQRTTAPCAWHLPLLRCLCVDDSMEIPGEFWMIRRVLECACAGRVSQAKMHLVDLAGSEKTKQTGAEGNTLKARSGLPARDTTLSLPCFPMGGRL